MCSARTLPLSLNYNFYRIHKTLRVTPATAAGLTDRLWEIRDVVAILEAWRDPIDHFISEHQVIALILFPLTIWAVLFIKLLFAEGSVRTTAIVTTIIFVILMVIGLWRTVWGPDAWVAFMIVIALGVVVFSFWQRNPDNSK